MSDITDTQGTAEAKQVEEFKEYPKRYTTLIGFILITSGYSLAIFTFNPISAEVSTIYDIQPIVVNMNSLAVNFLHLPLSFPVGYLLQKLGLQHSMRIAGILALIGIWMRTFINHWYYFSLFGSIFLGIGNPISSNSMTTLSLVWFRAEKREPITRLLMIVIMIMVTGGSMLSGIWLSNYSTDDDKPKGYSEGRDLVQNLMQIEAYISTGLVVIGILIFGDKPPTPPSFSASQKRESIQRSLKALLKNKDYLLVLATFSLFLGTYLAMGVTLSFVLKPFGFKSDAVSFVGLSIVVSGVIGNGIGSQLFKKNPRFKAFILFGVIGAMVGYGLTMVILPFENKILAMVPYIVIGGTSMQCFPVFLELSSECGFPVAESFSSGFLQGASQMAGFIFGIIFSLILDGESEGKVYIVQVCNLIIFAICIFNLKIMKVKLNRKNIDAKHDNQVIIINEENEEYKNDNQIPILSSSSISSEK